MRNSTLILAFLLVNIFALIFINTQPTQSLTVLGIQASDGTAIQVYTEVGQGQDTMDTYIPQDCVGDCQVGYDSFFIWLSFPVIQDAKGNLLPSTKPQNVTLYMYALEWRFRNVYNPVGEGCSGNNSACWVTTNTTDYTKLVSNITISIYAGQGTTNRDTRYGITKIDSTSWTDFTSSENKTKILVIYQNLRIPFYHKTDYSLIPRTMTNGEFNSTFYTELALFCFVLMVALWGWMKVMDKMGHNFPPLSFTQAALIASLLVIFYLLNSSRGYSQTLYQFLNLPVEDVVTVFALAISIYIPSMFRNKEYGKALVISFKVPYIDQKTLFELSTKLNITKDGRVITGSTKEADWITLYYYTTLFKKRVYTYNKNSFFGFFTDLVFGGVKCNWDQTTRIPVPNSMDEVFITTGFSQKSDGFIPIEYRRFFYPSLIVLNVAIILLSIQFNQSMLIAGLFLLASVVVVYINHEQDKDILVIEPTMNNTIASLTDPTVVNKVEIENAMLWDQKTNLEANKNMELARLQNASRYEAFLIFGAVFSQKDFADNLSKYEKIYSSVGLNINDNGSFKRTNKDEKTTNEQNENIEENFKEEQS